MHCSSCARHNPADSQFCNGCGTSLDIPVGASSPAVSGEAAGESDLRTSRFVGRFREMEGLKSELDAALSGQGRLVMLGGEPGIGKTRTVQEIADYAHQRDAQVLWGWCYEEEGSPPYWPWVQAIRSYIRQVNLELLHLIMGPGAANIAEIVAEVKNILPDLELPPAYWPADDPLAPLPDEQVAQQAFGADRPAEAGDRPRSIVGKWTIQMEQWKHRYQFNPDRTFIFASTRGVRLGRRP